MKNFFLLLLFILSCATGYAQEKSLIRVACVGNSITEGVGVKNQYQDSYPGVLSQLLGDNYDVRNFGLSARTLMNKGDLPYMHEWIFRDALNFNPDIVTIKLGTNDSKPHNWIYKKDFKKDLEEMIDAFQSLPSHPRIYLCFPVPPTAFQWGINDSTIVREIIPFIKQVAKKKKLHTIDLHTALLPYPQCFPDHVHPNEEGAVYIAREIFKELTGKTADVYPPQPFPGKKSIWNGHDRYDFKYKGRQATVVVPKQAAKGNPWIWRPAFFDAFPSVDKALLEKGFHVAYYDLTHLYGSPNSVNLGTDFYNLMIRYYGLSHKVTLEGFSRGGLFAFNWAARNTDKVACIYVDAPVCNLQSWPGRKNAQLWNDMMREWNLTDEQMPDFKGNPIDNLASLAKARIPVMAVCGDSDKTVPYEENMGIVRERYLALGAPVEVILKKGCDHHPHSLDNPEPVVDFILRYQSGYNEFQHLTLRGSLSNSYLTFTKGGKGRVAFLGGSITEMTGWRTMIQEDLKQRFPDTDFEFIDAGIGSTGTTPGAFRLAHDILDKGTVDLLFVEAAVNDDTNGFTAKEQVRGMEGEIRHALLSNPAMDIVMLHFIYDSFIPIIEKGRIPDVILNHERVANHYLVPSVNLSQEIAERMHAGEFDWEAFGGTHPLPFGHRYYAATINKLFDNMWSGIKSDQQVISHEIPTPLDNFSYSGGRFIDLKSARLGKGWNYEADWTPTVKGSTRNGFVNVPMLETNKAGARLSLDFKGTAIGIFCVAGPQAGILEYSIDGSPFKKLDTFTAWSSNLYIPWVYMFDTELENKAHKLDLRMSNENSKDRFACQIRNFVVNE